MRLRPAATLEPVLGNGGLVPVLALVAVRGAAPSVAGAVVFLGVRPERLPLPRIKDRILQGALEVSASLTDEVGKHVDAATALVLATSPAPRSVLPAGHLGLCVAPAASFDLGARRARLGGLALR